MNRMLMPAEFNCGRVARPRDWPGFGSSLFLSALLLIILLRSTSATLVARSGPVANGVVQDTVSGPVPVTYEKRGYQVHILENPGARSTPAPQRSVLVLGLGSDSASLASSRNFYNPATGRRFDSNWSKTKR